MARSKFMKVKCTQCKEESIVFEKATTNVACKSCGNILSKPSGGKAKLNAKVVEVFR